MVEVVKTCQNCKYEELDIYEKPCYDCVSSKRWIKFDPSVTYSQWKAK